MMSVLARSDLLITVDSGPMHVGAALGIPMVIIEQAWPIALRIAPGARFTRIKAPVPCAPCREHVCPIKGVDTAKPPCQTLDSKVIVKAARKMLPNFYPQ
jgi:ADP-heptose:LPS heptosyltransferase